MGRERDTKTGIISGLAFCALFLLPVAALVLSTVGARPTAVTWGVAAAVGTLVALVVLLLTEPVGEGGSADLTVSTCPACGKSTIDEWRLCPHCGQMLECDMALPSLPTGGERTHA